MRVGCARDEHIRWPPEAWRSAQRARARSTDVRVVIASAPPGSYGRAFDVVACEHAKMTGALDVLTSYYQRT